MSFSTLVPVYQYIGSYMLLFRQSTVRIILRLISVSKSVTWYSCKIIVGYISLHF